MIKTLAEKQAALAATVVVRRKGPYGRQPRKIGEIVVDTGIKGGYRNETASFILRLDVTKGEFIAEHGDDLYVATTREALVAKMEQVGRAVLDLEWTRYLVINYKAITTESRTWRNGHPEIDLDEARKKRSIHGMKLTWEIVEFSNPFTVPGADERYMKRDVDAKGKPSETQETVNSLPDHCVVYTKDREALLHSITEAFTSIDAKMVELFKGDLDAVAARLDAAGRGVRLLAAPKGTRK